MLLAVRSKDGKDRYIQQVNADTTIADLQQIVADILPELNHNWPAGFSLSINSIRFDPAKTIGDYPAIHDQARLEIVQCSLFNLTIPKPEIIKSLKSLILDIVLHNKCNRTALFIGIGSACLSGQRAKEQQCPDWFLDMILKHPFQSGLIILTDVNFGSTYNNDVFSNRSIWTEQLSEYEHSRKFYHNSRPVTIYTFATNIPDEDRVDKIKIAGFPYSGINNVLTRSGGVLIAGNFYKAGEGPYFISDNAKLYFRN